jgi:hypothetical protein
VNTAILNDCHDRYDSVTDLSAVPRDSTHCSIYVTSAGHGSAESL